jgi:hypothetical protein
MLAMDNEGMARQRTPARNLTQNSAVGSPFASASQSAKRNGAGDVPLFVEIRRTVAAV